MYHIHSFLLSNLFSAIVIFHPILSKPLIHIKLRYLINESVTGWHSVCILYIVYNICHKEIIKERKPLMSKEKSKKHKNMKKNPQKTLKEKRQAKKEKNTIKFESMFDL
jgi:hypothetical protein